MYSFITGSIRGIDKDIIVVENNGIGYKINTPNPYNFTMNEDYKIYTYFHVREDAMELFGFLSNEEKGLFERLISVKGIGPKTACAILATGDVSGVIHAIETSDVKYLKKFPKIGPKAAQQIILDLQGKLTVSEQGNVNKALEEAVEALTALGYTRKEIDKVKKVLSSEQLSTQEYITKALKLMLK
ncbi:Holliday junction branch migration protein RuvA [Haloplasma contractile]|uniref:Holliday junction branch migration complex subunit RuvA n=1 Tax=Haloplasma contractile SSD-17B TaxID=1033810 RepID=F7PVS4_9MOLU|nr:Holliday junction branch migration protein RuvA [Haloplasma contractile]ERJ12754.1 Holliday junction ATP-dependent DNA helicase RuvA protein [Haloplasma contractile SSD-17B]